MPAPTADEQLMLELTNRMRADPAGEYAALTTLAVLSEIQGAIDYFGVALSAYQTQMKAYSPVAPLAWNDSLAQAAHDHSQAMIAADTQSHQLPGEPALRDRVEAAGYTGWNRLSENIYAYSNSTIYGHAGFVIDWGYDAQDFDANNQRYSDWQSRGDGIQDPPNHRDNLLSGNFTEIGIDVSFENDGTTSVGPMVITQDLGNRFAYQAQFLGVVIDDADNDNFYDIGEGLGGVTVTLSGSAGVYTTTTWASGGWQIAVPAGTYDIEFSGGSLTGTINTTGVLGSVNVKIDVEAGDAVVDDGTVYGTTGNDSITGTAADDVIDGLAGDDTIIGARGQDTIRGGPGNDTIIGAQDADTMDGGEGIDTLSYSNSNGAVVVNLLLGTATGFHATGDSYSNFENVFGSRYDDTLTGDAGPNTLIGYFGDDWLDGGEGDDVLEGQIGVDYLLAGPGADYNSGGRDADTVDYSASPAAVVLRIGGVNSGGWAEGDTLYGVENLIGSDFDDYISGSNLVNILEGGEGDDEIHAGSLNDTLRGGPGNDLLNGSFGADVIDGGPGIDTATYFSSFVGVTVDLAAGTGLNGHAQGDTLIDIENVIGAASGGNTLTGNDADNRLQGFGFADTFKGAGGNDLIQLGVDSAVDTIVYDADNFGNDTITQFTDNEDIIDLRGLGLSFADVNAEQFNASTILTFNGISGQITLIQFDAANINAADFMF